MFIGAGGFVFFILFLFWIWALFDCISTDAALCRHLPKLLWVVLVIFLADIGALLWVFLGRPPRAAWRPGRTDGSQIRRPVPIDEPPRTGPAPAMSDRRSAELDERLAEWEREQAAKGDLDGREREPGDA